MAALLPIMAAVFVAFLVTGLAMPMLPLHVHEGLGCVAAIALSREEAQGDFESDGGSEQPCDELRLTR